MPHRQHHDGVDPFTFANAEKKQKKEKQGLAEVRNKVHAVAPGAMRDVKILGTAGAPKKGKDPKKGASGPETAPADGLKRKSEGERTQIRKREHKSLMKSLTLAQMSTGSMGKFDRKAMKNEPAAPKS